MSTSKIYQIRYNTVSKDDTERWRLIENGNETLVANIIIDGSTYTTKDWMEEIQDYKWHLTCEGHCEVRNNIAYIKTIKEKSVLKRHILKAVSWRVIGTIDVSGSTFPNSEIIIPSKGVYRILFSAQCDCTSGTHDIDIFPVVNGISVPNSNTRIALNGGIESCLTVEYFLTFNTNDILQFVMTGDDSANASNARLLYVSSAPGNPVDIPAIPSIIVTIQQISF